MKILIVNPGSTSTKIGLFEDETPIFENVIRHDTSELAHFEKITDQYDFRVKVIEEFLAKTNTDINTLSGIVGMGGLLKPVVSGTYLVNDAMVTDLREGLRGEHASNLGGLIAQAIGERINKPAYIVDPVTVDEFEDISRVSGHPKFKRRSIFHALNQKAIARQYCKDKGKRYDELNLIVVHMGGGISVGMHLRGRVVDANNALNGDGPFTPERSGSLPVGDLAELCFSGEYTHKDVKSMIVGKGGMVAYFGSNNIKELEEKAKSDPEVKLVLDALAYQIAKEIGSAATVACGEIDAILLTGGIAHNDYITSEIARRVEFIAEVKRYPGEDELAALNAGALRVLRGEEEAKIYI